MFRQIAGARLRAPALAFVVLLGGVWACARAAPRIPASDDTILERVPQAAMTARLESLRARLREVPGDRVTAMALARAYIEMGRAAADPRFVSYAQSTLAPWLASGTANAESLVLGATALQYLHRFDAALHLLERALALEPFNAQALLTKATLLQVQGRFESAREPCRALIRAAGQLVAVACLASLDSRSGRLAASEAALRATFSDDPRLGGDLRAWILGIQADMAARRGDLDTAEQHYQAALAAAPDDVYIRAEYADLLLMQQRAEGVVALLEVNEAQDVLLLRLAIAGRRTGHPDAGRWSKAFRERFEAARRDGDSSHLREQARYFLDVEPDAAHALELARANWRVQREPADVRIYRQAALVAHSPADLRAVGDWIAATGYEDRLLASSSVAGEPWVQR